MIVQVWRRAMEADLGPVIVAAGEAEIVDAVAAAGGRAVLTRPDHPSGSDRIFEALAIVDPDGRFDAVVNLQGDLPTLDPGLPASRGEAMRAGMRAVGLWGAAMVRISAAGAPTALVKRP